MIEINLLPGARKKSRRGGAPRVDFASLTSGMSYRIKDRWLAAAVICGVVSLAAVGTMYVYQSRQESQLTNAEQLGLADSTRYASVLNERVHLEAKRDTLDADYKAKRAPLDAELIASLKGIEGYLAK